MKKHIVSFALAAALLAAPLAVMAVQLPNQPSGTAINLPALIQTILYWVWTISVVVIIIDFIMAGFLFLSAQGDPSKVAQARSAVIYGVVAVVVILLAFSIVTIVQVAFGIA